MAGSSSLHTAALLLLLAAGAFAAQADTLPQCSEDAFTVHFTVASRRNASGHHSVTADLMNRYPEGREDNETTLDVLHTRGRCGKELFLRVSAAAVSGLTGSTSLAPRSIPAGYELYPGQGYYKLYAGGQTWAEAQRLCQTDGAHLIVINSEGEADVVRKIYARKRPDISHTGAWAGYHAQATPGSFLTVFGETLSQAGYARWAPQQPGTGRLCGDTFHDGLLYAWNCGDSKVPFICELRQS